MRRKGRDAGIAAGGGKDSLRSLQERYASFIETELRRALEGRNLIHYGLMRYHLGWEDKRGRLRKRPRGKLLRPMLCLSSCEAVGGEVEAALPAAAAVELLHNFSLIHDDIEDRSPQRHGRDTVWRLWGVPLALNAGDGMFALAHVTLQRLNEIGVTPEKGLAVMRLLDVASLRLCEGQYRDLSYEQRLDVKEEGYLEMVSGKTAALMAASAACGALIGDAPVPVVGRFEELGRDLGYAFQIRDDILGIWGKPSKMGKLTGEDIRTRKKSFPIVHALGNAAAVDAQRLRALYRKDGLDDSDVEEVLGILERTGSQAYSQQRAASYALRALGCVERLDLVLARMGDLRALAHYFVNREA